MPAYDVKRGEPRGKLRRGGETGAPQGDCIDCFQCVQVCPTGVDIRDGSQLGCITCGLCIDACDVIMDKVGKPRGLIRYASLEQLSGKPAHKLYQHPRTLVYLSIILIAMSGIVYGLTHLGSMTLRVIPERQPLFVTMSDGSVQNKYDFKILKSVVEINNKQIERFSEKIVNHFNKELHGKTFAVWGLAFKPNTDDVREAPSINLIGRLLENKTKIKVYDPAAMETSKKILGDKVEYCETPYTALENADALIIVTEWNEFRTPDFLKIKKLLKDPVIFDGRNLYDLSKMEELGFTYYSVGRKAIISK